MSAFDEGMQARRLGKSIKLVPYRSGTSEHREWCRGWQAMHREREPNTYSVGGAAEYDPIVPGTYRVKPTNRE